MELIEILQYLSSKRGVVAKVSKETGIAQDNLYKWKDGRGKPKGDEMTKLVDYMNKLDIRPNRTPVIKPTADSEEAVTQAALLKVLFNEVSKLKAKVNGVSIEDAAKELDFDTTLAMKDILKG